MRILHPILKGDSFLLKYILVWLGIALTFLFAVFPELVLNHLGFLHVNLDIGSKLFSGINAILLTILAFLQESLRKNLAPPGHISALGKPLPSINGQQALVNSAPLDIMLILGDYPSFHQGQGIELFLKRVLLLANFKPIVLKNDDEILPFLKNRSVRGLFADKQFYEKIILHIQKSHLTFFEIHASTTFTSRGGGVRVSLGLPEHSSDSSLMSTLAHILTPHHGPDTPRGIGFHGNWAGTYGIMSFKQDDNFQVNGTYWYAGGKITGVCEIDDSGERLVLHYDWHQGKSNSSNIGSNHFGKGIMVIPAGYDFLYGYWCPQDEQELSQGWAAARLCDDISGDILKGGAYQKDFGLHQHPRTELIEW